MGNMRLTVTGTKLCQPGKNLLRPANLPRAANLSWPAQVGNMGARSVSFAKNFLSPTRSIASTCSGQSSKGSMLRSSSSVRSLISSSFQRSLSRTRLTLTALGATLNTPVNPGKGYKAAEKKLERLREKGWENVKLSDDELKNYQGDIENKKISGRTYVSNIRNRLANVKKLKGQYPRYARLPSLLKEERGISLEEAAAIQMYTSEAYQYINPFMRGEKDKCVKALEIVNRGRRKVSKL